MDLTTELSAVNAMLIAISESPVNSLANTSNIVDVAIAQQILNEVSAEVQKRGWNFNSEEKYPLVRNVSNEIIVPSNTLSIDNDPMVEPMIDVVQRGNRLYDKKNQTYKFDHTVKVSIVFGFNFDDLPEAFKQYIKIVATRRFVQRMLGSQVDDTYTKEDFMRAQAALMDFETETGNYNIFNDVDTQRAFVRG